MGRCSLRVCVSVCVIALAQPSALLLQTGAQMPSTSPQKRFAAADRTSAHASSARLLHHVEALRGWRRCGSDVAASAFDGRGRAKLNNTLPRPVAALAPASRGAPPRPRTCASGEGAALGHHPPTGSNGREPLAPRVLPSARQPRPQGKLRRHGCQQVLRGAGRDWLSEAGGYEHHVQYCFSAARDLDGGAGDARVLASGAAPSPPAGDSSRGRPGIGGRSPEGNGVANDFEER